MTSPASAAVPLQSARGIDASLRHLLGRLAGVEARVTAAVARRRAADPNPDDGFRGLYITHEQVDRILAGPQPIDGNDERGPRWLASIEAEADAAEACGDDIRLRRLIREFHLEPLDAEVLLIALAPDLDTRFERLYGYLHDDVSRRRPSIGLALELCGVSPTSVAGRGRFNVSRPLVSARLLLVEEGDRPFLTRSLRVPDRVTAHLLGDDTVDPSLAGLAAPRAASARPTTPAPTRPVLPDGAQLGYMRDCAASAGPQTAIDALHGSHRIVLALDLERLTADAEPADVAADVGREARLLGAAVVASAVETVSARGSPSIRPFTELECPTVLVGSVPWDPAWSSRVPVLWDASRLTFAERAQLWSAELENDAPGVTAASATAQFRLSGEQIARAATAARLRAAAAGRALNEQDLHFGARAQNSAGLDRLARRIAPAVGFSDLVLPAEPMELLRDLVVRAQHRETVLDAWKVGGATAARRGLTALFAGPSGTGKTMAAEVIARELGLELCAVDLATVVDKYIGETEKNLDRIFQESERINCVLLFDEADALFGKRSEVSDAHDRYANVETAYLLQRMEQFDGIALLATNLRCNLDEAFTRRLDAIIDFPEPDDEQRLLLWKRCLGEMPRSQDVDLEFMAQAFKLAGGSIRNVAVAAAFLAAGRQGEMCMADLARATQREYRKLGRLYVTNNTDFLQGRT